MSVYVLCGCKNPKEGVESPGTRVTGGCEMLFVCWQLNLGLLLK